MAILILLAVLAFAVLTGWLVGNQVFRMMDKNRHSRAVFTGIFAGTLSFVAVIALVVVALVHVVEFRR